MANSSISSANTVEQWQKAVYVESLRSNQFAQYMGRTLDKAIVVNEELGTKPGHQITMSLIGRLTGDPVVNDDTLLGNEAEVYNSGHKIEVSQYRTAISVGSYEEGKSHIDILNKSGVLSRDWLADLVRNQMISALGSACIDGVTPYASCTEAQKDIWVAAQYGSDRVLFGAAISNYSASDHSASLLNVDSTTDVLSTGIVSLARRVAERSVSGKLALTPINGLKSIPAKFVLFVPSVAMRDFKTSITTPLEYAGPRGNTNPLFSAGDLLWDGVVIHEVPEIGTIAGVGNGGIAVAPCYLVGQQALGMAVGERSHAIKELTDYGNIRGSGIAQTHGIEKLMTEDDGVQIGVMTVYVSGVADT
jgi:N4-gp56 family major capsid protein